MRDNGLSWWRSLLRNVFRHSAVERDLDDELEGFVEERAAELARTGVPAAEALRRARRELGGGDLVKENVRDGRAGETLLSWLADARLALRLARRAPLATALVVATLALGIGGATALFGVVAAVTVRPLPFPAADRLVHVWGTWPGGSGNVSFPDYRAIREGAPALEAVAAYEPWGGVAATDSTPPQALQPSFVTGEYLAMLGARPALGSGFAGVAADGTRPQRVALVSHAFWQRRWGGDPRTVGATLELNGQPFTVTGVLPSGFRDLGLAEQGPAVDVWLPVGNAETLLGQPPLDDHFRIYWVLGRLRPGATVEQAREQLEAVAARMAREHPDSHHGYGLAVQELRERLHGPVVRPATLLLAGAALLLVIACANLAGTLGSRFARRRPEMAVRAALGAGTRRLLRQLLVETALLAAFGGLAGCLVAWGLVRLLGNWIATNLAAFVDVRLDGTALGFAAAATAAACAALAVAPALEGRRAGLAPTLRAGGRGGGLPGAGGSARGLVLVQVALATVLLVGAGLMARTLERLQRRDVGYPTAGIITFQLELTGPAYVEREARVALAGRLEEAFDGLPGVRSATLLGPSRLAHSTWILRGRPTERAGARAEDFLMMFRHSVDPGALGQLGVPLLAGRELDGRDHATAPPVAVVSASVAAELWPGIDPIGRQLMRPDAELPPITVVGVAADVMHRHRYSLDDVASGLPVSASAPQRDIYMPYAQRPNTTMTWALRLDEGSGRSDDVLAAVRSTVAAADPDLPILGATLLDERLAAQEGAPGAVASLLAAFAAFAVLLAAIGVYGVVSQALERRTREVAVRLALGADPRQVLLATVAAGTAPAAVGAALGVLASVAVAPALAAFLVGVGGRDPLTLAVVPLALLAVAAVAAWVPTRRLLAGEPLRALRGE
jgi:putative ABC transport system permease protein